MDMLLALAALGGITVIGTWKGLTALCWALFVASVLSCLFSLIVGALEAAAYFGVAAAVAGVLILIAEGLQ
ncbi:MAG TPA: hypothetical protein VFJ46_17675 [Xanthobacteraceae bacterium]|nr:hypothetical protein [Xanthobacteraceae bacterium]